MSGSTQGCSNWLEPEGGEEEKKQNLQTEKLKSFCFLKLLLKEVDDFFVGKDFESYAQRLTDELLLSKEALSKKYPSEPIRKNPFLIQAPRGTGKSALLKKVAAFIKEEKAKKGLDLELIELFIGETEINCFGASNVLEEIKKAVSTSTSITWTNWWSQYFEKMLKGKNLDLDQLDRSVVIIVDSDILLVKGWIDRITLKIGGEEEFVRAETSAIVSYKACFRAFFEVLKKIHLKLVNTNRGGVLAGIRKDLVEFIYEVEAQEENVKTTIKTNLSAYWDKYFQTYIREYIQMLVSKIDETNILDIRCAASCSNCKYWTCVKNWDTRFDYEFNRIMEFHLENGDRRPRRILKPFECAKDEMTHTTENDICELFKIDWVVKSGKENYLKECMDLLPIVCARAFTTIGHYRKNENKIIKIIENFIKQELYSFQSKEDWKKSLSVYTRQSLKEVKSLLGINVSSDKRWPEELAAAIIDYFINIRVIAPSSASEYEKSRTHQGQPTYAIANYFKLLYSFDREMFNKYENKKGMYYNYERK